jgi:hypothetical protein
MKKVLHHKCNGELIKSQDIYYCNRCSAKGDYWFAEHEDEHNICLSLSMGPPGASPALTRTTRQQVKGSIVDIVKILVAFISFIILIVLVAFYNNGGFWITWIIIAPILWLLYWIPPIRRFIHWTNKAFEEKVHWSGLFYYVFLISFLAYLVLKSRKC